MFEQALLFALKGILRDFVEDGDHLDEKVRVGVWSGRIVLEDLVLKNSILSLVDVPIALNYGYIGRLEINIPWSRLGSEPVTVLVEKLYVLVEPKYEWNPGAADRREQAMKQAKLAAAELFANQRLEAQSASGKYRDIAKNWFVNAFLGKVLDNIQITVREVHIRYEDRLSCPSDFCIGFSFESLVLQSRAAGGQGAESVFSPTNGVHSLIPDSTRHYEKEINIGGTDSFFKLVELSHLAVYWNPMVAKGLDACSVSFVGRSPQEIQSLMTRTIATRFGGSIPRHHYIVKPVDITAYIDMALNVGSATMKAHVRFLISEIAVELEDRQLREIISMALNMSNFSKLERFSEFRPTCSVRQGPRLWWRYAINAVLVQLRLDRQRKFSCAMVTRRIEDKMVYIELWKSRMVSGNAALQQLATPAYDRPHLDRTQSLLYKEIIKRARRQRQERERAKRNGHDSPPSPAAVEPLDESGINLLRALEYDLPYEDLLMFRSAAEASLSQETRNQGWMSSVFSWATGGKPASVTDEERRKLFDALKYDPDKLLRGETRDVDLNEVNAIVQVHLAECSVTLGLSSSDTTGTTLQTAIPFFQLRLSGLQTKTVVMGDGTHVRVNLSLQDVQGFEIYPSAVPHTRQRQSQQQQQQQQAHSGLQASMVHNRFLFRRNLRSSATVTGDARDTESVVSEDRSVSTLLSMASPRALSSRFSTTASVAAAPPLQPPLFSCAVEKTPNDQDVEMRVRVDLDELEIWLSPSAKWIHSLGTFAAWPEDLKYWSEMEMDAMNQLADLKSRVNAKLEYMMNNHSNVVLEARVRAPVVVIHDKPSVSLDNNSNSPGKLNILVIDLGLVSLHTEKLAKAQRRRDLELLSQFTVAASNVLPISTMSAAKEGERDRDKEGEEDKARDWEILQDEFGRAMHAAHRESEDCEDQDMDAILGALADDDDTTSPRPTDLSHTRRADTFDATTAKRGGALLAQNEHHELDSIEEDLFDVFQCHIRDLEVYLVEAQVTSASLSSSAPCLDLDKKLVIVARLEVDAEIQVSVLPWDATLPPIKLFVEIPEVCVQLSEEKLVRLAQFGAELAKGSTALLQSSVGKKKIEKLSVAMHRASAQSDWRSNAMANSSVGLARSSALRSSSSKIHANSEIAGNKSVRSFRSRRSSASRRRARSMSATSAARSLRSELEFFDACSQHDNGSAEKERDRERLRALESGGDLVESESDEDEDDDDMSFFSVHEENEFDAAEHAKALEEVQFLLSQRENTRAKLVTDLRIAQSDAAKTAIRETLQNELRALEMEIHTLKISYVELLMKNQDGLHSLAADDDDDEEEEKEDKEQDLLDRESSSVLRKEDRFGLEKSAKQRRHDELRERVETFLSPNIDRERSAATLAMDAVGHKRDLIHASVFKLSTAPESAPQILDVLSADKELLYLRVNVRSVHVDLQLEPRERSSERESESGNAARHTRQSGRGVSPSPARAVPLPPAQQLLVYRLSLCEMGLKVRHRVSNSRVSCFLRDVRFVEHALSLSPLHAAYSANTAHSAQRMRFEDFSLQTPFLTSDPSFALSAAQPYRPFAGLCAAEDELLRVKYELSFPRHRVQDELNGAVSLSQSASHSLGVHVGYLAVNLDQERLLPLVEWALNVQEKVAEKFAEIGKSESDALGCNSSSGPSPSQESSSLSPESAVSVKPAAMAPLSLPRIDASLKVHSVALSVLRGAAPVVSLTVSALGVRLRSEGAGRATLAVQVVDVSLFNLFPSQPSLPRQREREREIERDYHAVVSAKNVVFGKNATEFDPFLAVSLELSCGATDGATDFSAAPAMRVTGAAKVAGLVCVLDPLLAREMAREACEGAVARRLRSLLSQRPHTTYTQSESEREISPPHSALTQPSVPHNAPTQHASSAETSPSLSLHGVSARIHLSTRSVRVYLPCLPHHCCGSGGSGSGATTERDRERERVSDVLLLVSRVRARLLLGALSLCGGIETDLSLRGVGLSIAAHNVIDPLDVAVALKFLPTQLALSALSHNPPSYGELLRTASWSHNAPSQREIQPNEAQLACGVSAVRLHVKREIVVHLQQWLCSAAEASDAVARIVERERPTDDREEERESERDGALASVCVSAHNTHTLSQSPSHTQSPSLWDGVVSARLCVHSVALSCDASSLCGGDVSGAESCESGSDSAYSFIALIQSIEANATLSLSPSHTHSEEREEEDALLRVTLSAACLSVHEEQAVPGTTAHRLVVAGTWETPQWGSPGDTQNPPQWGYYPPSPTASEREGERESATETEKNPFLSVESTVSRSLSVRCAVCVAQTHSLFHPTTVTRALDRLASLVVAKHTTRHRGMAGIAKNAAKPKGEERVYRSVTTPMSATETQHTTLSHNDTAPLPATLVLFDVLRRIPMPSISVSCELRGVCVWLPFRVVDLLTHTQGCERERESVPTLCAHVALSSHISLSQPSLERLLAPQPERDGDETVREKWLNAEVTLRDAGVGVMDEFPQFFSFSLFVSPSPRSAPHTALSHNLAVRVAPRVWLAKVESARLDAALFVENTTSPVNTAITPSFSGLSGAWRASAAPRGVSLKLVAQAHTPSVEIQAFLDYRPYVSMYEAVVAPVVERALSLSLALSATTTTQHREKERERASTPHNAPTQREAPPRAVAIVALDGILSHFAELCATEVRVEVGRVTAVLYDDLRRAAFAIARLSLADLEIHAVSTPPPRQGCLLTLSRDHTTLPHNNCNGSNAEVRFLLEKQDDVALSLSPPETEVAQSAVALSATHLSSEASALSAVALSGGDVAFDRLRVRASCVLSVDYLNRALLAAEPFLEPAPLSLNLGVYHSAPSHNTHRTHGAHSALSQHGSLVFVANTDAQREYCEREHALLRQFVASIAPPPYTHNVPTQRGISTPHTAPPTLCVSLDALNVNVTMNMLELLFGTLRGVEKMQSGLAEDFSHVSGANGVATVAIRNETGVDLAYWDVNYEKHDKGENSSSRFDERRGKEEKWSIIPPGTERSLGVVPYGESFVSPLLSSSSAGERERRALSVSLSLLDEKGATLATMRDVSLEGAGCRLVSLPLPLSVGSHSERDRERGAATPSVVLELSAAHGLKTLTARSTMRLFNATTQPFAVKLVNDDEQESERESGRESLSARDLASERKRERATTTRRRAILWETLLVPGEGVFVPAPLCALSRGTFLVTALRPNRRTQHDQPYPSDSWDWEKSEIAEFPCPELLGFSRSSSLSRSLRDSSDTAEEEGERLLGSDRRLNGVRRRKSLSLSRGGRGAEKVLRYTHWLSLRHTPPPASHNALSQRQDSKHSERETDRESDADGLYALLARARDDAFCCTVSVESRGAPGRQHPLDSASLLRSLSLHAPLSVVNLLGSEITVAVLPDLGRFGVPCCMDLATAPPVPRCESELCGGVDLLVQRDPRLARVIPQSRLRPGESKEFLSVHASESVFLSLAITPRHTHNNTSCGVWSAFVRIPGCALHDNTSKDGKYTLSVALPSANGASLEVFLEMNDIGGARVVHCFAPYWVASEASVALQIQHDVDAACCEGALCGERERALNGVDGLAADQPFSLSQTHTEPSVSLSHTGPSHTGPHSTLSQAHTLPRGVGRARGSHGVLLGPLSPLRGLPNILRPAALSSQNVLSALCPAAENVLSAVSQRRASVGESVSVTAVCAPHNAHTQRSLSLSESESHNVGLSLDRESSVTAPPHNALTQQQQRSHRATPPALGTTPIGPPVSLVHAGYTRRESGAAALRVRHRLTDWSASLSLDKEGERVLSLATGAASEQTSYRLHDNTEDDGDNAANSPFFHPGEKLFEFGVKIEPLDPPFQRTKVVHIVDRYNLVNRAGEALEVRQAQQENVFSLREREELPLWWRPHGKRELQVRLSRYGCNWSGCFAVTDAVSEFPIRLRNELDNTVNFLGVSVLHIHGQLHIIFKAEDEVFVPFRVENHTLETFRFQQTARTPHTVLLPFHACVYAWDEPLCARAVRLWRLRDAQRSSRDDWQSLRPSFAFDLQDLVPLCAEDDVSAAHTPHTQHLCARVVTRGAVRVLQIVDTRAAPSPSLSLCDERGRESPTELCVSLSVRAAGLSLVDAAPAELLYLSLSDVVTECRVARTQAVTRVCVRHAQVDNQLLTARRPALLRPDRDGAGPLHHHNQPHWDTHREQSDGGVSMDHPNGDDKPDQSYWDTSHQDYPDRDAPFLVVSVTNDFSPRSEWEKRVVVLPRLAVSLSPLEVRLDREIAERLAHLAVRCVGALSDASLPTVQHTVQHGVATERETERERDWSPFDWRDSLRSAAWTRCVRESDRERYGARVSLSLSAVQHVNDTMHVLYGPPPPLSSLSQQPSRNPSQLSLTTTSDVSVWDEREPSLSQRAHTTLSAHMLAAQRETHRARRDALSLAAQRVFCQSLAVSALRVRLSLDTVSQCDGERDTALYDRVVRGADDDWERERESGARALTLSLARRALRAVARSLLSFVANIEDCPLQFTPYTARDVFLHDKASIDAISLHYGVQAALQSPLLLLSSNALGNPVQVVRRALRNAQRFVRFAVRDTVSLHPLVRSLWAMDTLANTTGGALGGAALRFASACEAALVALGVVDVVVDASDSLSLSLSLSSSADNAASPTERERALSTTVTRRPTSLWDAVYLGLTGVVLDPLRGLRESGARGLFVGLATGALGLVARPAYGALRVVTSSLSAHSLSVSLSVSSSTQLPHTTRVRPPRYFVSAHVPLQVYSAQENLAQELLARIDDGRFRRERCVLYMPLPRHGERLLMTRNRLFHLDDHMAFTEVLWSAAIKRIASIAIESESVSPTHMSLVRETQRNVVERALQLVREGDSGSSNTTRVCELPGEPVLCVYCECATQTSAALRPHRIVFASHDALLRFLAQFLPLAPHLATEDVRAYLSSTCGVDIERAMSLFDKPRPVWRNTPRALCNVDSCESLQSSNTDMHSAASEETRHESESVTDTVLEADVNGLIML